MLSIRLFKKISLTIAAALLCGAAAFAQSYALARLSVVSMRSKPSHAAEQISQALMGTPMHVLEQGAAWSKVQTPDGYEGWIINHSLVFLTDQEFEQWKSANKVMITESYEQHGADRITDLVCGNILVAEGDSLRLPDGRMILSPVGVMPLNSVGRQFKPYKLVEFAALYYGVPYEWGGLSSKGMDCSGLVRMAYLAQGRILPRDAWQQALQGEAVSVADLQVGDLIFFGNAKTRRVTHVGIYAGNGEYVHSSQMVRRNSLKKTSPLYLPLTILACRRVEGTLLTDIVSKM
jgi:SH3-like domain-containing protein